MINSENSKVHRDLKDVKKLRIKKKLESELEEILVKHLFESNGKKHKQYPNERKSILRKSTKK